MLPTDVGAEVKVVAGFSPRASAGEVINGAAINRQDFQSCVLHARSGAVSGAPTAVTYDARLQESADGITGWTDIPGAAVEQITAADTEKHVNVNLAGVKPYIRVVGTVAFTGGTSPTLNVAATVVLGGAVVKPTSY
jgi:hypothetical protein